MNKCKYWLSSNRIYFETAVAMLLGVMAIIVSAAQLWVASDQTVLAAAQLEVARLQISPRIHVFTKQIFNQQTQMYDEDQMYIQNLGAPAFEANSSYKVFLVAKLQSRNKVNEMYQKEISLNAYYGATAITQAAEGLMFSIQGYKNNKRMAELNREFRKLAVANGYFSDLILKRYLNVSYANVLGEQNEAYYYVKLLQGAERIPNNIGAKRFKQHSIQFGTELFQEFETLTADKLFHIVLSQNSDAT